MKCVIPCAGRSSRMSYIPKHLITIRDEPLLWHIIDTWRDVCDSFVFVVSPSMGYLLPHLPPDETIIVLQSNPEGLADAILQSEKVFRKNERFVIALGDCLHKGTFEVKKCKLGVGVWPTENKVETKKNYLVKTSDAGVHTLIEKPLLDTTHPPYLCGMGTYFMDTRLFKYIRTTKVKPGGGDLTLILQRMIFSGEEIQPIRFTGQYVNVGSPEDIERAEEILR